MVRQWSLPNYFSSKTKNFAALFFFLRHATKNSRGQMRQISGRMEIIHPKIGWRRDEHGTHKQAHGSWILWSVSRVRSKTMHSLAGITSWLPYINSVLHRFEIFLPLEQSLESIPVFLPVRSESRASHQSGYRCFFHCPGDINVRMRKVLARALSCSECVLQLWNWSCFLSMQECLGLPSRYVNSSIGDKIY